MIEMNKIKTLDEVLQWIKETADKTEYGTLGVDIRMARGQVVYINPKYNPAIKVEDENSILSWSK